MKSFIRITALLLAALFVFGNAAEDGTVKPNQATPAEKEVVAPMPTGGVTPAVPPKAAAPKFPIESENFKTIEDDNAHADESMPEAANLNEASLLDVIAALDASTQEHLKANVDTSAEFKKLFNHPDNYRGHVVQFESTIKFLYDQSQTIKDHQGRAYTLVRGHVSSSWQLITFLSMEPLPQGMKIGDTVLLTGVFLQKFAYINRKTPGRELTWTPLIVVKKVEPYTPKESTPLNMAYFLGSIIFVMVAIALLLLFRHRQAGRDARANVFRTMRIQREGKDRQFPSGGTVSRKQPKRTSLTAGAENPSPGLTGDEKKKNEKS